MNTTWCLQLSIVAANVHTIVERIRNCSTRFTLTIGQISVLQAAFRNNFFPNKDTSMLLARQTGLTERRVRRWFGVRRRKIRRGSNEGTVFINEEKGDDNSRTMNIIHTCESKLICNTCRSLQFTLWFHLHCIYSCFLHKYYQYCKYTFQLSLCINVALIHVHGDSKCYHLWFCLHFMRTVYS